MVGTAVGGTAVVGTAVVGTAVADFVEVGVNVTPGVGVLVASVPVGVLVKVLETTITTVTLPPNPFPEPSTILQYPV